MNRVLVASLVSVASGIWGLAAAQPKGQPKHNTLNVPSVKTIRVTYHYPKWSGLKDMVEDPGGDLRAVEGTEVELAIQTDRPLNQAVLIMGDHRQIDLKASEGNWFTARVPINKDGVYHVASIEHRENVRMTEDFFIEARKTAVPHD